MRGGGGEEKKTVAMKSGSWVGEGSEKEMEQESYMNRFSKRFHS